MSVFLVGLDGIIRRDMINNMKVAEQLIENLAIAVKNGFDGMNQCFDQTATKDDIKRLEQRIDILEHRILNTHANRLDILEDAMRQVKTKLGIS